MLLACATGSAQAVSNTSAAADWRLMPGQSFNGVAGPLDAVARLWFDNAAGQSSVCSGTLLAGGTHVLTAAHCAQNFSNVRVDFGLVDGTAAVSRTVAAGGVSLHGGWDGTLSTGADLALLRLDTPVTSIQGAQLSQGNDLGSDFLFAGYGMTTTGASRQGGDWSDWGWAHWGMNTFDVSAQVFKDATSGGGSSAFGDTWLFDFDARGLANRTWNYNALQALAGTNGNGWRSGAGLGSFEALLAPGDSGAGAFVWDGSQWLLSGVMSWTMQACDGSIRMPCDHSRSNPSSFGDIAAATAVYNQAAWIEGVMETRSSQIAMVVTAVPEPSTYALFLSGAVVLAWAARRHGRRRSTSPLR